jgi:hypothetical protein
VNLFVTSLDPEECARNLDDKRVGKMLMEANQMMSLAVKSHWPDNDGSHVFYEMPDELTSGWSHLNHPVSRWVRETRSNYIWTLTHAKALASEFKHRYGRDHGSSIRINFLAAHCFCLPAGDMLPFQNSARHQGLGLDFSDLEVPYSYREYLNCRWITDKRAVTFTNRNMPKWSRLQ